MIVIDPTYLVEAPSCLMGAKTYLATVQGRDTEHAVTLL